MNANVRKAASTFDGGDWTDGIEWPEMPEIDLDDIPDVIVDDLNWDIDWDVDNEK